MKKRLFCWMVILCLSLTTKAQEKALSIFIGGNAYVTSHPEGAKITDRGIVNWTDSASVITVFFHVDKAGPLDLAISGKGHACLDIHYNGKHYPLTLVSDSFVTIPIGTIDLPAPGYQRIDLKGLSKERETFGTVRELIVKNFTGQVHYVGNFSFYWGRRGPSVHLNYPLPKKDIEWFYNEMTVPEESEILSSFYMANGFGEGYFGMQYNTPTEKRILFSVWSPFHTQNPNEIPKEDKLKLLRHGPEVTVKEFGNDGSGGQSYLKYPWKAGKTYKFLTHIHPDNQGNTVYTAYFFATDQKRWRLIASFLRPKTHTWHRGVHSFLENFDPLQGYLSRSAVFSNQWIVDREGNWYELTEAGFSYDSTAESRARLDYQGGVYKDKSFYLKNGGFFNENTPYGTKFLRKPTKKHPSLNFQMLENL